MGLKKRGGVYHARFQIDGKEIMRSTGTSDPRVARRKERELYEEIWAQRNLSKNPRPTFDQAVLDVLGGYAKTLKPRATERYKSNARTLSPFFSGKYLDEIDSPAINALVKARRAAGIKDPTIRRDIAFLSLLFREAKRDHPHLINAAREFDKRGIKESKLRVVWMRDKPLGDLLDLPAHYARLKLMIIVAKETGIREDEMLGLEWDNIIPIRGGSGWALWLDKTKTDRPRTVPLTSEAARALIGAPRHPTAPWVFWYGKKGRRIKRLDRIWKSAKKAAGIADLDFRWHDWRHHAATMWRKWGVPLDRIKELLGHSTLAMVMRYAAIHPDDVIDSLQKAEANRIMTALPKPEPLEMKPAELVPVEEETKTLVPVKDLIEHDGHRISPDEWEQFQRWRQSQDNQPQAAD